MKLFKNVVFIRVISIVALVLWMGVIFSFSAQTGTDSKKTSSGIVQTVAKIITPGYDELSEAEKEDACNSVSEFVRSAAHFCVFAVLGFLSLTALLTYTLKMRYKALYSVCFGALYAVSDEVHQYFVPERAFQFVDIAVDALGVAAGVAAMLLIRLLVEKFVEKRRKNDKKA